MFFDLGLSLLYAWQQQCLMHDKNKTTAKSFEQGCRAMRVRFQCFASWEEYKLAKWKEAEDVKGFAETLMLVGLKRCRALADLQAFLQG